MTDPLPNCCICGRELGGVAASEFGVCSAASDKAAAGTNGGRNGGRICQAITGTLCGGKIQGTFAQKELSCMSCGFYKIVREEEGTGKFQMLRPGQKYQKSER